ncbi:MotA/TolQ/ExbB proton channel family protein [Aquibacillus sediminis]|uniref:MotA/TolQ/ExbB proton channel family protein n=1 Tax=Aquibacillus sediminis TaxID=2574734 RepID=UPI0011097931|nr:MotA/TolQ/ExbB proton channel family protein [Aquibacillus sediminis]
MVEAILQIFISEQKAEAILANDVIELIFMVLFVTFTVTFVVHILLFNKLRKLRNYLNETGRMDIEPLRTIKEQFDHRQQEESVKVDTFVQEKFSSWCVFNVPVVNLIKMIQMTVSVFILIGVLGTFIGLTMSLGSIDAGGEQLVENVASVLAGIDVAFYTSIAGMGCSLIMTMLVKICNTEFLLTDMMLKVETNLAEEEQNGLARLIDVTEMIHSSINRLQETNQQSLQGIENSFQGFQDYTEGLQQSAEDLATFNQGLASNLEHFQVIFQRVGEMTEGFEQATAKLNDNFDQLFSYFNKMDERNDKVVTTFEKTYEKMKGTSEAQMETLRNFEDSVDDLKQFTSSVADGQSSVKHAFEKINQECRGLAEQMKAHNQEFKNIFGHDLSAKLSGMTKYLSEFSRDFQRVGDSITPLPQALEAMNQTQAEFRNQLTGQLDDLKRFNDEFHHHLKSHATETFMLEKHLQEATTTYEQVGIKNNQLIKEMNDTISQMQQGFQQRENQLDSNLTFMKDTLSRYVATLEGELGDKLDKVVRTIGDYMDVTNTGMKKEFKEIRQIVEEMQQTNGRYTNQTFTELNQEIQKLNQQLHAYSQETSKLNDAVRLSGHD